MKSIILIFLLGTLSFASSISLTVKEKAWLEQNPKISMVVPKNFPKSYLNENGKLEGMDIDYLSLIEKRIGVEFDKKSMQWGAGLKLAINHQVDIISNAAKIKVREPYLNFSKTYFASPQAIVTHDNQENISDLNELCGKKIAIHKDSAKAKYLKNNYPCIELVEVVGKENILSSIVTNKAYGGFDNLDSLLANIKKMLLPNLKIVYLKYIPPIGFARLGIRKDKPILLSILNKAIESITVEEKNKIVSKWLNTELPPINNEKTKIDKKLDITPKEIKYLKDKKQITMCIDPNWMPFDKFDKFGKHVGIGADYTDMFRDMLDVDIQIIRTKTWTESKEFAKKRKCDILSLAMETEDRKEYLNFTTSYLELPIAIATKIKVPFVNDLNSIKYKKIGMPKGYALINVIKQKYKNINIVEVENTADGIDKVTRGKIFGFIGSLPSISYEFQQNIRGDIKISGKFSESWELGLGVRNDDLTMYNIFQKAVNSITQEKKDKILNKWLSIKYEESVNYTLIWKILLIFSIIIAVISIAFIKQKKLKKSIEIEKNKFKNIFEKSTDGILILTDGVFTDCNDAIVEILQYENKNEILSLPPSTFSPEFQPDGSSSLKKSKAMIQIAVNRGSNHFEWVHLRADKSEFWADITLTNIGNIDENIIHVVWRDITDKKIVEKELKKESDKVKKLNTTLEKRVEEEVDKNTKQLQLLQQQIKMAQMGEMIGAIAHQWRQPLNGISTSIQNLQFDYEDGFLKDEKYVKEFIDKNKKTIKFMSNTIDDFRNFFRVDKEKKNFKVKHAIESVVSIYSSQLVDSNITLHISGEESIAFGFRSEFEQVILNIISNAKDALVENKIKSPYIDIEIQDSKVVIEDNAGGIPQDILSRVFEPYFTTKEQGKGTGMGLYMSKMIIEDNMGGELKVENRDNGALFTINFNKDK